MSKLEQIVMKSHYSIDRLAQILQLPLIDMKVKLRDVGELTPTEITTLIDILHITNPIEIFLSDM